MVIATLAGCHSHRHLHRGDNGTEPRTDSAAVSDGQGGEAVVKPRQERLDTIRNANYTTYSANFSCTVQGVSVSGQIRMDRDSVVWVSVSKIIELGRAKATPTRVQAYAKLVGKSYDLGYGDIRQLWGIDIDFGTLQALLTGNCPPDCRAGKEPQRDGDTVTLWYSQAGGARQLTLKKDYGSKLLTETDLYSKTTGQRVRCRYTSRSNSGGQLLPSVIAVTVNSSKLNEQMVIKLDKITLGQPQSYPFKMMR